MSAVTGPGHEGVTNKALTVEIAGNAEHMPDSQRRKQSLPKINPQRDSRCRHVESFCLVLKTMHKVRIYCAIHVDMNA